MSESKKFLSAVAACIALGVGFAGQASAEVSHVYSHSIGSASSTPPAPYPISDPHDVAVDSANGDIYVTDPPNYRVQKFDSDGNFLLMFGKEVNATTSGNVCTAASGNTCKAGVATPTPSGFLNPAYLAVDNYPNGEGAVYVGDQTGTVKKFTSGGVLMTGWGGGGQKDGSDAFDLPVFEEVDGIAIGGRCATPTEKKWQSNCEAVGTLYVNADKTFGNRVFLYTQSGQYMKWAGAGGPWMKTDPKGKWYTVPEEAFGTNTRAIQKIIPVPGNDLNVFSHEIATDRPTAGFALDPSSEEIYQATFTRTGEEAHEPRVNHYPECPRPEVDGPCEPLDSFGEAQLNEPAGVAVNGDTHGVYVANEGSDEVLVFADARPIVTTGPVTAATDTTVTLSGSIDPAGRGDISECYFEYGFEATYGDVIPCIPDPAASPPGSHFTSTTAVSATITGLSPGTTGHYRLVARNVEDAGAPGLDRTFASTARPAIVGLAAERLTATTADLIAKVNPNGRDTKYRFEYGTTPAYGQTAPVPDGQLSASYGSEPVEVHLTGLTPRVVYHYRLVVENDSGSTAAEDHTFNFYPPSCPNENVRQQTQANFLPDCRAYELVSPGDAGGTQLWPNGPNPGFATSPPRFAYVGAFGSIPGAGGEPAGANGDLYVATRTAQGWESRYVGWPAPDAPVVGGPPMGPPGSQPAPLGEVSRMPGNGNQGPFAQDGVLTDLAMDKFLSFNGGLQSEFDTNNRTPIASNSPRVYAADGSFLDRWPTNLPLVPDGSYPPGSNIFPHGGRAYAGEQPATVAPGGDRALDCPSTLGPFPEIAATNLCPGDVTASADLTNFIFASTWNVFAPGGQLSAPGSVYDNDTTTGAVTVASKTSAGENIPNEPGDQSGFPLEIPAVSRDGSHILIAANGIGPCGYATCGSPPCGQTVIWVHRCPSQAARLYLRVGGAVTYDVSRGHAVRYVGIDEKATRVYFVSDEQLTTDDLDTSTDLYQWTEAGDQLNLISKGDNAGNYGEPGNSDSCAGGLSTSYGTETSNCGVTTYTQWFYCERTPGEAGGGNCLSDNSIARESGDIYFFSQEQLDGTRGLENQENLYVFRNGEVQFVTVLTGPPECIDFTGGVCPHLLRMQVSPNGSHMSFVTASPVTQYENAGYKEVYRYIPDSRELICVSCIPSGEPPTSDAEVSINGLFMTDDGRTFFTTEDPLVHVDTNDAQDVYEYVEGHSQLITLGTGETRVPGSKLITPFPGLVGVSADGRDVYFGTFDTLVPQDNNGLFMKFYDARSGGGFPAPAPPPPCAAADECHGPDSEPPAAIVRGTGTQLGSGGNASQPEPSKGKKKGKRKSKRKSRKGSKKRNGRSRDHRKGRESK